MPAKLKEVRNRIASISSTQQITKAMKLVSASKLRKAQERITQMRPYAHKLNDMLQNIAAAAEGNINIEYAKTRTPENILLILLTSDRGLCGGFNANLIKLLKNKLNTDYATQKQAKKITLLCIGKKGYEAFKRDTQLTLVTTHQDLFNKLNFENASAVAEEVMQQFSQKQYDLVDVFYNEFKNQITQIPTAQQFLPIQQVQNTENKKTKNDFIFEPELAKITNELVPKILKTRFFSFLLDNNASEHGSRMSAMDKATTNADELLKNLKIDYNRARQASITTELTEIISGAAALQN